MQKVPVFYTGPAKMVCPLPFESEMKYNWKEGSPNRIGWFFHTYWFYKHWPGKKIGKTDQTKPTRESVWHKQLVLFGFRLNKIMVIWFNHDLKSG